MESITIFLMNMPRKGCSLISAISQETKTTHAHTLDFPPFWSQTSICIICIAIAQGKEEIAKGSPWP